MMELLVPFYRDGGPKALGLGVPREVVIGSIASGGITLFHMDHGPWVGAFAMSSANAGEHAHVYM
jgi:hypothetical protein